MDIRLPQLNRIPGMAIAPREKYINDLSMYTIAQLQEILDRGSNLLHDKKRLSKLPDKGKRIIDLHEKVSKEIVARNDIEKAAQLFSNLNIATEGIKQMTKMEWNGKYEPNSNDVQTVLDSDDDDETDPLKIIAQNQDMKKKIKVIKPERKLITDADLEEIKSSSIDNRKEEYLATKDSIQLEPHAIHLCDIESHHENRSKYLPYKTTKTNVHSTEAEKSRKTGKHWEITAATPPPIRNREVKELSIQESIDIQKKQYTALKIVEEQNAEERLKTRKKLASKLAPIYVNNDGRDLSEFFGSYREFVESDEDLNDEDDDYEFNSDDEVHDEEPISGGVSVVVHEHGD